MGTTGRIGHTRAVAATLLLAAATACTSPTGPGDDPAIVRADVLEARVQDGVHLLVQLKDLDAYPEALYRGPIVRDERGCVRLSGSGSTVLWPKGFTAEVFDGRVVLRDGSGAAAGALGETFRMGGGHVPTLHEGLGFTESDHQLAVSRCPGDFWLATPGTVERVE